MVKVAWLLAILGVAGLNMSLYRVRGPSCWALLAEWLPRWPLDVHFQVFCILVAELLFCALVAGWLPGGLAYFKLFWALVVERLWRFILSCSVPWWQDGSQMASGGHFEVFWALMDCIFYTYLRCLRSFGLSWTSSECIVHCMFVRIFTMFAIFQLLLEELGMHRVLHVCYILTASALFWLVPGELGMHSGLHVCMHIYSVCTLLVRFGRAWNA